AKGGADRAPHHDCLKALVLRRRIDKVLDKPRFSDPRLTDQADELGAAVAGKVEAAEHPREFRVPPDHRRLEAEAFKAACRIRCLEGRKQAVYEHIAALAPQDLRPEAFECETM